MKTLLKYIGLAFSIILVLTACETNPTLQKYFVDSKENSAFISVDLPASMLQLKNTEVSEEIKSSLATIKKVNFLALQLNETNKELYTTEKQKVKKILENSKYKELMRFKHKTASVQISFLGKEDAIDEVIIFATENDMGLALVRVLGENMNPADILKLVQEIKFDSNSNELKQFKNLVESLK